VLIVCFVAFFFAFDALLPYKDGEVRARPCTSVAAYRSR
jgi:hypothetical protein